MNSFANSLFSLLFGWARTLIQRVWTSAVSGNYSGFFSWLGDHWLWVALILCAAGTAMDFLIWILRWRPDLVWRTKLRRVMNWLRTGGRARRRFEAGYQGGVGLEMPQEPPVRREEDWDVEDWDTPAAALMWQQEPEEESAVDPALFSPASDPAYAPEAYQRPAVSPSAPDYAPPPYAAPAYAAPAYEAPGYGAPAYEAPFQPSAGDTEDDSARRRMFVPAADYELPPINPSTRVNSSFATDLPSARRRRRSEKYERRKPAWRDKLIRDEEEEDAMLDGLPPAVDREQAFHEPVYPRPAGGDGGYYGWQRGPYPQQANGNQE